MEVTIGIGLDNLVFGMTQDDIKTLLGEPNKISDLELDFAIIYYYNEKMLKTKFDKDENLRLYSIEVFKPDVLMFDQKVIGQTKEQITSILKNLGFSELEFEDYDTFDTVFSEKIWTTFCFEFDRLVSFEFSPLFEEDGETIIWPKRPCEKPRTAEG